MPNRYVRSADGNNADDGSTWALADATMVGSDTGDAAGDTIWLSQAHAESTAGAVTINYAGTVATPSKVLCGNDAAEPPTSLATTATVTTIANGTLSIGGSMYVYGVTFTSDSTTTLCGGSGVPQTQIYENCSIRTTNTGSAGTIQCGSANNQTLRLKLLNTSIKFAAASQSLAIYGNHVFEGVSFVSGTSTPTALVTLAGDRTQGNILWSGCDLSNLGSTVNLCQGAIVASGRVVFRNCKLPASWSGSLVTGTIPGPGPRFELYNCDSTDTNYRLWVEDYAGSIKNETTIVRTGGATDGTTQCSWKMVSSANAEYPLIRLESPERVIWNDTTGSALTAAIEIVTDNVTLTDGECWLEVMYLGTSGFPLGAWITDAKSDVLATAADQATSAETWTTTGLTTPVKQKLSVTFTPQEKGAIHWRVVLCKASTTVYVDPKLTVA